MTQQTTDQELVPSWKIKLNGSPLAAEVVPDVLAVEVEQHINGADAADISINAWDMVSQELRWLDDGTFAEGSELEVLIGYGEEPESLFKGEIVALQVDYGADQPPVMHVEAFDMLHRLRRGRHTRTFNNIKDSELAAQIAQELQLEAEVEDSTIVHTHLFQHNQSDIDFLRERARRIHFELDVEQGKLRFRPWANNRGKAVTLSYGEDLKSFNLRLSTLSQVKKVIVRGWDVATKEAIVGLGQAGDEVTKMNGQTLGPALVGSAFGESEEVVVEQAVFDQAEADQIAKAVFNRMTMELVKAEGECLGNPLIAAGEVIEIARLGQRMSGLYYLLGAHHIIDGEGYRTKLFCQRNAVS